MAWLALGTCILLGIGCTKSEIGDGWRTTGDTTTESNQSKGSVLTIGDIDPDTPVNRMTQIRPLANYLARSLGWEDTYRVRIRIARSVDEMASMIEDGKVDIFMDSIYCLPFYFQHPSAECFEPPDPCKPRSQCFVS